MHLNHKDGVRTCKGKASYLSCNVCGKDLNKRGENHDCLAQMAKTLYDMKNLEQEACWELRVYKKSCKGVVRSLIRSESMISSNSNPSNLPVVGGLIDTESHHPEEG